MHGAEHRFLLGAPSVLPHRRRAPDVAKLRPWPVPLRRHLHGHSFRRALRERATYVSVNERVRHWHCPLAQASPAPQTVPHVPQFSRLDARSAQTPAQSVRPVAHAHVPPLQTRPSPQVTPQKPQLASSVVRSAHELPHRASPEAQLVAHAPSLHTCPCVHSVPHAPQLRASLLRSVQVVAPPPGRPPPPIPPMHAASPVGQAHTPDVQVSS